MTDRPIVPLPLTLHCGTANDPINPTAPTTQHEPQQARDCHENTPLHFSLLPRQIVLWTLRHVCVCVFVCVLFVCVVVGGWLVGWLGGCLMLGAWCLLVFLVGFWFWFWFLFGFCLFVSFLFRFCFFCLFCFCFFLECVASMFHNTGCSLTLLFSFFLFSLFFLLFFSFFSFVLVFLC